MGSKHLMFTCPDCLLLVFFTLLVLLMVNTKLIAYIRVIINELNLHPPNLQLKE